MLIVTAARPGPNIPATTVGKTVKYPPLATPFRMAKASNDPKVLETDQIASMLKEFSIIVMKKVFVTPVLSHRGPPAKRLTALHALNTATRLALVVDESSSEQGKEEDNMAVQREHMCQSHQL
jgi:hypothetical protein